MYRVSKSITADGLIWILTVMLLSSFSINNVNVYSSIILFGITTLVFLLTAIRNGGKIRYRFGKLQVSMGIFGLFSLFSMVWAINSQYAIEKGVTILEILVCVTVFYWAYMDRANPVRDLLKAFMWSGFAITLYSFSFYGTSVIMDILYSSSRMNSAFDNVNNVSFICAISIIIAVFFAVNEKMNLSVVLIIPTLLLMSACGSRKAMFVMVGGVFMVFVFKAIAERKVLSLLKLAAIVFLLIFVVRIALFLPVFSGINERMEGLIALATGNGQVDHSAWVRQQYIILGMQVFKEHPFVGVGMGNVRILNEQALGDNCYLHNNYAELLANGGIIGFGIFYSMYVTVIIGIIKKKQLLQPYSQILILIMLCFLVGDYGSVTYYSKYMYFYFLCMYIYIERMTSNNGVLSCK